MKVSVVIPVYNTEKYLSECLDSFLQQSEKNIEIICINDESTDGSLAILKNYSKKDKRVKFKTVSHAGAGAARNKGIDLAKGEYIYFFDSDDIADKELLRTALAKAEEADADIVAFHGNTFENNDLKHVKYKRGFNGKPIKDAGLYNDVFSWKDFPNNIMSIINVVPWNKLYKTEFVKNLPFRFNEISSTNDIAFSALSTAAAKRIAVIPDRLTYYRVNRNDSITSSKKKNLNNIKYAVNSVIEDSKTFKYHSKILNSVLKFAVSNYCFSFENYGLNLEEREARDFYVYLHDLFNSHDFINLTAEDLDMLESNYLYRLFINIQKYNLEGMKKLIDREIIVSMTSVPQRIGFVYKVINNICMQTKKANRIILWLANEEFSNGKKDLPDNLLKQELEGKLEIRFCENLYAHKKYYYAMQENPESIIITVDDDIIYDSDMIARLWHSYLCYPECVSTMRCHIITVDRLNQKILPYKDWVWECGTNDKPSLQAFSTNGAGALYPPHLINELVFEKNKFMQICRAADDIWLNAMCIVNNVKTVSLGKMAELQNIEGTQDERLFDLNFKQGMNDIQFTNVKNWLTEIFGYDIIYNNICTLNENEFLDIAQITGMMQKKYNVKTKGYRKTIRKYKDDIEHLQNENKRLSSELEKTKKDLKKSTGIRMSIKNIIRRLKEKFKKAI